MKKPLKLQTNYPILDINWFRCAKMPTPDWFKENKCDCPPRFCLEDCQYGTPCDCWIDQQPLTMTKISPWSLLIPWTYQVSWGRSNAWYWGQIISVELPKEYCDGWCKTCDSLFVEYYAWYRRLECRSDEIHLPEPLLTVLSNFVASYMIAGNEVESANLYNKWVNILRSFALKESHSSNWVWSWNTNVQQYPWKNVNYDTINSDWTSSDLWTSFWWYTR
jgi:hypothetical protein